MPIPWLETNADKFPSVDRALVEPNGLLAAGGDLSVARLLDAYSQGIFPWYESGQPVLWWSPDPRMILRPSKIQISRSLNKLVASRRFEVSMDRQFAEVLTKCAATRRKGSGTWITDEMRKAYTHLHELGYAHSVEVWSGSTLVGGLYGVALGQIFFGESMFSGESNTSKLALVYLAKQLQQWDFQLIDCQVSSAHLHSLGAEEVSRQEFKQYLQDYVDVADISPTGKWQLQSELLE